MIDRILNGLGDSSSSRSGAATTYSISTPSGTYTGLTKEQYDAWKAALDHYNNAYGIAYSYDLTAPNWSEFTMTNGQSIVDSYVQKALNSGKKSKSESWQTFVETRAAQLASQTQAQTQTQPQQQAQTQPQAQPQQQTQPQQQAQTQPQVTPQNINIPEPTNVQTLPSNGDEKKGSGLLIPGLILVAGIVGAILLTKKTRR